MAPPLNWKNILDATNPVHDVDICTPSFWKQHKVLYANMILDSDLGFFIATKLFLFYLLTEMSIQRLIIFR